MGAALLEERRELAAAVAMGVAHTALAERANIVSVSGKSAWGEVGGDRIGSC